MRDRSLLIADFFERRYITGRLIAVVTLILLVSWSLSLTSHLVDARFAVAGMFVFVVSTLAVFVARRYLDVSSAQVLMWVLGFDLFAVALLGYAYHHYEDPAYPMLIALPIIYGLVVQKERIWLTGTVAAIAYLLIHAFAGDASDVVGAMIIIVKAVIIVVMAVIIADSSLRFRQRETEVRLRSEAEENLNRQLQRRLAELQAVSEITELIHSSLDFDHIGTLVLEILTKVINIPSCCLFVVDKSRAETLFTASAGMSASGVPLRIANLQPGAVQTDDAHFSCMSVVDHKQMMVVFCATNEAIEQMSEEDKLVLQAVSSELAVAVENSQLYKLTKRLAITDELTGLFNYRYLQQRLDEEIERASRYHKDLSFIMIDVDDFKRFNDTNGHIAGDRALADVSTVMRAVVREVDIVSRYGGEEFSVILPETDAAGAFVVAEKLREAISKHEFEDGDGNRVEHLTVSVGLASFPTHSENKEALLKAADDALYTAKSGAKNCVRSPRLTPPSGVPSAALPVTIEPTGSERG